MKKRLAFLLVIVGAGAVVLNGGGTALAHGSMTYPASRTYACYEDGRANGNGDLNPTNPACVAAIAIGGKQPLWDWFGNLIGNAAGRHREIIPDGGLCGPTAKYDAYNQARADWPVTQVRAGATVTLRYNAWAPHPGTWEQYVTKDGFDVTKPLKWSDLEPAPFDRITNPPLGNGEYSWTARLPSAKSGRHIIYSIWQRSDSPEAFYSCSDVVFSGGTPDTRPPTVPGAPVASSVTGNSVRLDWPASTDDQGVTGYRVHHGDQVVDTTTANSATVTGLSPETPYTFHVVALDGAGNASAASAPVTVRTGTAPAQGACSVKYTRPNTWSGGYTANIVVANSGAEAVRAWVLSWDFPATQRIAQAWSSEITVADGKATAKGSGWNTDIAPGGSVSFGFNAATTDTVSDPASFTLNGLACTTS